MSVVSNQYANKIFSQHPIGCWPLDEDVSFVSLCNQSVRDLSSWSETNGSIGIDPELPNLNSPFSGQSDYYSLVVDDYSLIGPSGYTIQIESTPSFSLSDLEDTLKNFHVNAFIYQDSLFTDSYEIGIKYWDIDDAETKTILQTTTTYPLREWKTVSATIDKPSFTIRTISASGTGGANTITVSDASELVIGLSVSGTSIPEGTFISGITGNSVTLSQNLIDTFSGDVEFSPGASIVINFNLTEGGGENNDYSFIIHGLSCGQWSEKFCFKTTGTEKDTLPSSINLQNVNVSNALQYGKSTDNSYYIIEDNILLSKNEGVPMVFGSENVTKIYPSKYSNPSLVMPSLNMFSSDGKNNYFTLEFWMRIRPNTKEEIRIFGPLDSLDGLYVSEGFMSLSVGGRVKSFSVYEWYRPMLVNITYSPGIYRVFINGEEVLELEVDLSLISDKNDWLGFFGNNNISLFEIDCLSIMPYQIPLQVAKIRLVWGQGTESEENIDDSFKGKPYSISFPSSNYAVNSIYPDKERWDAGYYRNLVCTTSGLSTPEYYLPEIFLSGRSIDLWYADNKKVNDIEYPLGNHPKFFTFRPNLNDDETVWQVSGPNWTEKCYLNFSNSSILSSPIEAFYAIFEVDEDIAQERILASFINSLTGKRLDVKVSGYTVSYEFNGSELYSFDSSGQEHIVAGFHISTMSDYFGYDISSFFSSFENLNVYIGGAPNTASESYNTFEGKIYKVSFVDQYGYGEIDEHFMTNGFVDYTQDELFVGHYSTYSVKAFDKFNSFFLDISLSSYWEEYFPLTHFCKNIKDVNGNNFYGFDFLQFNVGYPSIVDEKTYTVDGETWANYVEFEDYYNYPISYDYSFLQNSSLSGFTDYQSLVDNDYPVTTYLSNETSLKIHATFQTISSGIKEPIKNFAYEKLIKKDLLIDASKDQELDPLLPYGTKYQVVDGSIIYPPNYIDINDIAIVFHFNIEQEMAITNKLTVRDMEISSKAMSYNVTNPIGTKSGREIYPYTKTGIYYSYKEKNPLSIYKKETPYLYLTEKSGIKLTNFNEGIKEYGVLFPINTSRESNYYVGAIQMFIKDESPEISYDGYPAFEIDNGDRVIEFYYVFDSTNKRKKIFARDKNTKAEYIGLRFYQNGINVQNPVLYPNEWNVLSVLFEDPINFSNRSGAINVFAGFSFDNVSEYRPEGLVEIANIVPRTWFDVYTSDNEITINNWRYWYDENQSSAIKVWKDVLISLGEESYGIGPENIYQAYTGTNIDIIDDGSGIVLSNDDPSISIFNDISWSLFSGKPS